MSSAPERSSPPPVTQESKPVIENEIQEVRAPSLSDDAEVAGDPSTKELTGFKAWWAKWGFEVKLLIALLLPVFVEVRGSVFIL